MYGALFFCNEDDEIGNRNWESQTGAEHACASFGFERVLRGLFLTGLVKLGTEVWWMFFAKRLESENMEFETSTAKI